MMVVSKLLLIVFLASAIVSFSNGLCVCREGGGAQLATS